MNLITRVNKFFKNVYGLAEWLFKPKTKTRKMSEIEIKVKTLNKLMKKFYKQPHLSIHDTENISEFETIATDGIKLKGIIYKPNPDSKKYVITSHWFAGHKYWALFHSLVYREMGYNIISFDFRNHGDSEKAETTLGQDEVIDWLAIMHWVKDNIDSESISLTGISMGAFITNFALIKYNDLCKEMNVTSVITEDGYSSIKDVLFHSKNVHLKFISKKYAIKKVNKIIDKLNVSDKEKLIKSEETNVISELKLKKQFICPTLVFHSETDKVTPINNTFELLFNRRIYGADDDYKIYRYSVHTQALRLHFKTHVKKYATFLARIDNTQDKLDDLIMRWELNVETKVDRLQRELE